MALTILRKKFGKSLIQFKQELLSFQKILSDKYYPNSASKLVQCTSTSIIKKEYSTPKIPKIQKYINEYPFIPNWEWNYTFQECLNHATHFFKRPTTPQSENKLEEVLSSLSCTNSSSALTTDTNNTSCTTSPAANCECSAQSANCTTTSTPCVNEQPGRHCYHPEVESETNAQIMRELVASYKYLSIACYFGRTNVALPGCYGFFINMYEEEQQHALKLINYQNLRGGCVEFNCIDPPACPVDGICKAFSIAVSLEKDVKEKLVELHKLAEKHNDCSTMDFLDAFIMDQERSICEMARLLARATKMSADLGMAEYLFDKEVYKTFVKKKPSSLNKGVDLSVYK